MQVATLFRESATLLGASMETGGVGGGGGGQEVPGSVLSPGLGPGLGPLGLGLERLDAFSHPASNKFKLNMKLEPQDDGYETSADLLMSSTTNHNDAIKCESLEDPYSFIDDDPMSMLPTGQGHPHCAPSMTVTQTTLPAPKKRGRKKKIKPEPGPEFNMGLNGTKPPKMKERKKHDRFNGMPEEEVSKRTLPDHLASNLDIIIIGINPGLFAAYKGHHYAGPGNHFWKCLYLSGLTPEQMTADEDYKLLQVGIGFTNMVQRPTKGSADLTRKEIKEGCQILLEKLQRFKPKIAVFNGKLIYEVFSGKKDFSFGRQPDLVDGTNTYMWVMPSSSARCAQLPRAADKVPFYAALKKFRDYLNGIVTSIDDSEVVFSDSRLKNCCEPEPKGDLYSTDLMDISNAVVKRDDAIPCKKKRGRPKKIKVEGEETKPVIRKTVQTQNSNNCDFPKKKRGRPKKIKCEEPEVALQERNTQTPISKCFSSPSPIQSPTNFYHMNPQMTPPSSGSNSMYNSSLALAHQPYSQSPRPHSQPFTHSDLSSEISAAISSDHLGSPAPTSPSLGPPDFDPPTSMPTDDTTECRFSSPAPSNGSEQHPAPLNASTPYPSYHTFGLDQESHGFTHTPTGPMQARPASVSDYKVQDMSSKSLSGLESLVDQIPSIADGEPVPHGMAAGLGLPDGSVGSAAGDQYGTGAGMYPGYGGGGGGGRPSASSPGSSSPAPQPYGSYPVNGGYGGLSVASLTSSSNSFAVTNLTNASYGHSSPNSYGNMMAGPHHGPFMDHHHGMTVGLPYPQLGPYGQQFGGGPAYGGGAASAGAAPGPPVGPPVGPAAPPHTLHVPSPNYPPPYYNASYPHSQPVAGPHSPGPGYLHNHMFDRIKPDIGYGGF